MSSKGLSAQDEKDLQKFMKYFVLKAVQIIVQSRLGETINTKSKPHSSGKDWFNLAITDHPDITAVTKNALAGQLPCCGLPLCVEISLQTVEGHCMVLEIWCIQVDDKSDLNMRIAHTVYNRMELLLKSLITVTRVTPSYKLSRRQSGDYYVICYRVYMGQPQRQTLGDEPKHSTIGQLTIPGGTITLSVYYRIDLRFTPDHLNRGTGIMVKSDHFTLENKSAPIKNATINVMPAPLVPKLESLESPVSSLKNIKSEEPVRKIVGAFAEVKAVTDIPELPSFSFECGLDHLINLNLDDTPDSPQNGDSVKISQENTEQFINPESEEFSNGSGDQKRHDSKVDDKLDSVETTDEDFVVVPLKTPFSCAKSEIDKFLRTWKDAPSLAFFENSPTLIDEVQLFADQLTTFETCREEFDELVQSLCDDEEVK